MSSLPKYSVVLDTNVFISGILFGGNAEKILTLFQDDQILLIVSPETIFELITKLNKFGVEYDLISELVSLIQIRAKKVVPKRKVVRSRDQKDNMILAAAEAGQADFIVTGDKDLLVLKRHKSTVIISPKEFLNLIA